MYNRVLSKTHLIFEHGFHLAVLKTLHNADFHAIFLTKFIIILFSLFSYI